MKTVDEIVKKLRTIFANNIVEIYDGSIDHDNFDKQIKDVILAWYKQEVNKILDELEKESKTVYYCQGDGAYWDKPNSECKKTCEIVENVCNNIFIVIDKQKISELRK